MTSLESANNTDLSLEELIRALLKGKSSALEKYDAIIWKIRSGYILILYDHSDGTGRERDIITRTDGQRSGSPFLLLLTWGMSTCAFWIDRSSILAKLQVIKDWNQLSNLSLNLATGKKGSNEIERVIREQKL